MRRRHHVRFVAPFALLLTALAGASSSAAVELGPQGVVRQFCQADALGRRATASGWTAIAPLVEWSFEPAWDHVVLIGGYEVGSPEQGEDGALVVEVRYSIIGQLSALGLDTVVYVDTVAFEVRAPGETGWRIVGPPPAPHIFGNRVDIDLMRRSLEQGGVNFIPDSVFVWQVFRSAGWNVPFERTADLLAGGGYRPVDRPAVGDLVVYLRDERPYHVGLLESEGQVVSSSLNAGIVRTAIEAFAGEVRYLRLVEPEPAPAEAPSQARRSVARPAAPALAASVRPRRTPTPAPAPAVKKRPGPRKLAAPRGAAQPSASKRVGARARSGVKPLPATPVATPHVP